MRILHTSDWHLGRTFHGRVLDDAQAAFADHLVELVRREAVDAVVVSGDVYDRAIPPTDSVRLLDETLRCLSDLTRVVLTPGNHDSAQRLGFGADLLREGLTIRARITEVDRPITIPGPEGADGLYVYALPYLDPDAAREVLPPLLAERLGESGGAPAQEPDDARPVESEKVRDPGDAPGSEPPATPQPPSRLPRSHEAVVSGALRLVAADLTARRAAATTRVPALVMSHAFVVGGLPTAESERDIRVGGVDSVPAGVYTGLGGSPLAERSGGLDYVALGHLHRPQEIRAGSADGADAADSADSADGADGADKAGAPGPRLVYSGSPLPFSFPEAGSPKSTVLLDIGADGVTRLERVPAPLPYRATTLTGTLAEVLARAPAHREDWVRVVLTGAMEPDAMARLKIELPNLLAFSHTPSPRAEGGRAPVTRGSDPLEIADRFLAEMLGRPARPDERAVMTAAYDAARAGAQGMS
mgnify:FL=1